MDAISDSQTETVVMMTSSQIGKTEILNNTLGYYIHQDPSPIMVVQPTIQDAESWSKTRLAPMIRDTPELRARVADVRSRDSGNTILDKIFPGGILRIRGANAPGGLARQPIRVVLCDEVDRWEDSAGTEGDPVDLALKRTTTFRGRRKHVLISTPGIQGVSRIEKAWNQSDQRHYYVPCPHCGEMAPMVWAQVSWSEGCPEGACYACKACGGQITDAQKQGMLLKGEWRPSRPFAGTAGFAINELYSPWRGFGEIAVAFLRAKHNGVQALKVWINTTLGEAWDPRDGEAVKVDGLLGRREVYAAEVPAGVGLLVAGCDVQDDRLEVLVYGVGAGEESWVIEHRVIPGNLVQPEAWNELQELVLRSWKHESGASLRIRVLGIDVGGHFGKQVYQFTHRPQVRGIVRPVKGNSRPLPRMVQRSGKKHALYLIDTSTAKDTIYSMLRIDHPGPGYLHFPQSLGPDYFEQLLSEHVVRKAGARVWEKVVAGSRNEALDLHVYALAALAIYAPRNLATMVQKAQQLAAPTLEPAPEPVAEPLAPALPMAAPVYQRPMRMPTFGGGSGAW